MSYIHPNENIVNFNKNDIIFSETDLLNCVFYVIEGIVKVTKYTEDGNEKIIDIVTNNDFLAVTLLMEGKETYGLNATCIKKCKLVKVEKNMMFEALKDTKVLTRYMNFQATKSLHFKNYLANQCNTNELILTVLKELYNRFGKDINNKKVIELPINKTDLANFIGLRRETLSRKLKEFHNDGIITIDKNTIYLNE